jgi:hypothetical protein
VLNASNYDKKAKLSIKKAQKHNEKLLIRPEKQTVTSKILSINRLMYGALFSVLFLQLFIVVAAPLAARVGYPLVVAVSSGVATPTYPGPMLIVVAAVAGFDVALATPRRYYGMWAVMAIAVVVLAPFLTHMDTCYYCKVASSI